MSRISRINLLLLAALLAGSFWAWPELPQQLPRHFGIDGRVDAWSEKSAAGWFLLPLVGAALLLAMELSARLVVRNPRTLSVPSKRVYLQLPPEEQREIARELADYVRLTGTFVLLLFGVIQYASWRAAFGLPTQELMTAVLVLALAFAPILGIWLTIHSNALVREAHRRATLHGTLHR